MIIERHVWPILASVPSAAEVAMDERLLIARRRIERALTAFAAAQAGAGGIDSGRPSRADTTRLPAEAYQLHRAEEEVEEVDLTRIGPFVRCRQDDNVDLEALYDDLRDGCAGGGSS